MAPHPLHNLTQAIHVEETKLLFTSTVDQSWAIYLFAAEESSTMSWSTTTPLDELKGEAEELATAVKGGYLHVHSDSDSSSNLVKSSSIQLDIILPKGSVSFTLERTRDSEVVLLNAAFSLLEPTSGSTQASEVKALRAQLTQKENEITSLNAKLSSARASVVRSSGNDKKRALPTSPQKKVPANASALQPNQKRRKAVEDEFAGSDDDDDD